MLIAGKKAIVAGIAAASAAERVTPADRSAWALRYFGLCGFLALGVLLTHQLTQAHGW
ncbi:MAG TPA: hypothetical protein VGM44_08130 [Polyangiaceae bacterium]